MSEITHFDATGASRMIDVGGKEITARTARAEGTVEMQPTTLQLLRDRKAAKGDVFEVARLAGIMAAKQTAALIPLCHSLPLDATTVDFEVLNDTTVRIESVVRVTARTGVEMEALTAVCVAGLTIYDMLKAVDRSMTIGSVRLVEKTGGRSGHYRREEPE